MCETVTTTVTTTTTTTTTSDPAPAKAAEPIDYNYPPFGLAPQIKKLDEWIQLGCGDVPYNCAEKGATWAPDGNTPAAEPDLSKHNNFMAETLKATPGLYDKLKNRKTSSGVGLSDCMKTGVDNPGHPHIKTVGLVAGDEESYVTFKELFDPIIDARHGGYGPDGVQPTNLDINKLSNTDIDPEMKYVLTTRVRTGRSVRGFKLPPVISFEDRRKLEAVAVKALLNMSGDLKGDYFPLHGSKSYPPKPNGMSEAQEEYLRSVGNLFQEPDSTLLLASGMARHWPDGRGIFHNDAKNLFVWLNEEDHLRIVSMQGDRAKPTFAGKQIKEVTARFIRACDEVQKVLKSEGYDFMHNNHLGFVLTCPSNLGTGLRAGTMVNLPKLSSRKDWKKLMNAMKLQARGTGGVDSASTGGCWDVSNADRIGKGEVDLVNILIEGAAQLVKWETMLDGGMGAAVEAEVTKVLVDGVPWAK
jgi:creatine kinase